MKVIVALNLAHGFLALLVAGAAAGKPAQQAQHPTHPVSELRIRGSIAHEAKVAGHNKIVPELSPVSDPKFMKQDYPDDRRPKVYHKFDYPYPTIQDGEDYDKDYVQDKNDDGGYWLAQMKYDDLKNKLGKEQDELNKALHDLMKQRKELQDATQREADAERRAKEAEARETAADAAHGKMQNDLENQKGEIDGAVDKVDGEITDLEECKRQLKEARAKLKALMEEKEKAEAAKKAGDKNEEGAEEKEVDAELTEEELEKSLDEARKDYNLAKAAYEKELQDVKDAEALLAKQATVLRKFKHADPGGGVYELHKGGSVCMAGLSTAVMTALAALFLM